MTTDELVRINKGYFIKVITVAAKTAIVGAFPFLATPPFPLILDKALNWLITKVADILEVGSYFIYIDYRVDEQGRAYVQAAHEADKLQTEEARIKADEAFKKFARFNIH